MDSQSGATWHWPAAAPPLTYGSYQELLQTPVRDLPEWEELRVLRWQAAELETTTWAEIEEAWYGEQQQSH